MKETNWPETRLHSWQPRRPSPGVKQRIFSEPASPSRALLWSLRCLAPSAACLLLALASLTQGSRVAPPATGNLLLGMIGSNQIHGIPDNYQQEQNSCFGLTFEWTNRSGSTSSISSFPPSRMN